MTIVALVSSKYVKKFGLFIFPFIIFCFFQKLSIAEDRLLIRNDVNSLVTDLEIGRFGTGKRYFDDPVDIQIDENEDIYVLDAGNYRIQIINEKGRYKTEWGSKGRQDGFFDDPVAMFISPENDFVVVLDRGTYRVHKFKLNGEHLFSFGEEGFRKSQFENPVDLTVDNLDYIYVLDRDRKSVLKFHKSGAFVKEWGNEGRLVERLKDPISIAYSDDLMGFVYVLDVVKGALVKYDREGDLKGMVNLPEIMLKEGIEPFKVRVNHDNEIFVLDRLYGKMLKFSRYQTSVFQLTGEDLVIEQPSGFAIDNEDRIYISDMKRNRFFRFLFGQD